MDESEINNEGPVQGQNIAQQQWITQNFYNIRNNAISLTETGQIERSILEAKAVEACQTEEEHYRKITEKSSPSPLVQGSSVNEAPTPSTLYIAHRYVLMETRTFIGRQAELNVLTDWVATPEADFYPARILSIVSMGGMGKSALTWKWFNDIAPFKMKPLKGRIWWSFYETDATFENFIIYALICITQRSKRDVQRTLASERETLLLEFLDKEPYLIAFDGLERILAAYANIDAVYQDDNEIDQKTGNATLSTHESPIHGSYFPRGQHRLRKTTDPRVALFLRRLAHVQASRILISTRLYPADLQTVVGDEYPGCKAYFLNGLTNEDALSLWQAYGNSGSRESLLSVFDLFDNHPLLIQLLAGTVALDPRAKGNFERWKKANPLFNPFQIPLIQVKSHILELALRRLDKQRLKVLHTIAAFRAPVSYETLTALFVNGKEPFPNENTFIPVLVELQDRGLLGWNRSTNCYDSHPIIRSGIWQVVRPSTKQHIYETLHIHFSSLPITNEEDLAVVVELYNTLIGLRRYDDAATLYLDRLVRNSWTRTHARQLHIEMLEALFPDGFDKPPRLKEKRTQVFILYLLAEFTLQLEQAAGLYYRLWGSYFLVDYPGAFNAVMSELSIALLLSGAIFESECVARWVIHAGWTFVQDVGIFGSLEELGWVLAARGSLAESQEALDRALEVCLESENFWKEQGKESEEYKPRKLHFEIRAIRALWLEQYTEAQKAVEAELTLGRKSSPPIWTSRIQGLVALGMDNLAKAEEHLYHALADARSINNIREELPVLVGLAELKRQQGRSDTAREYLGDIWELAERNAFRLYQADAFNILAQISHDEGLLDEAVEAARRAYHLAWCDGPPFTYHWGLQIAKGRLIALNVPEPDLPPFDQKKHQPMPDESVPPADAP